MSIRHSPGCGCCECPNTSLLFKGSSSVKFYNDLDEEITPSFDAFDSAILPSGYYAEFQIRSVRRYDAWEAVLFYSGSVDVDFDWTPEIPGDPVVPEVPGAEFREPTAYNMTFAADGTSDGGVYPKGSATPDSSAMISLYYRNTPKYVAMQVPFYRFHTVGNPLVEIQNGEILYSVQAAAIEKQIPITGWVRVTSKESGVLLNRIQYAAISREWVNPGYYTYVYNESFNELCKPALEMKGCVYEVAKLHQLTTVEAMYWSIIDGVSQTRPSVTPGPGNFRCASDLGFLSTLDQTGYHGEYGNQVLGFTDLYDPPPDPVAGNLWPTPVGRVSMESTSAYFCRVYSPTEAEYVPCDGSGNAATKDGGGNYSLDAELVRKDETFRATFPIPTFRLGWTVTQEFVFHDPAEPVCDAGCDDPADYVGIPLGTFLSWTVVYDL